MNEQDKKFCITLIAAIIFASGGLVLLYAFTGVTTVVTVDEASLARLDLAAPAANGAAASLAYNLSLAVAVRNTHWAMLVWRAAALDVELRLAGQPFALLRLAGAETTDRIRPKIRKIYRVAAAAEGVPLGTDGAAAFARDSATGVFGLELVVTGEFKYEAHTGSRTKTAICRLRIPLATSATATALAAFERTLPQVCVHPGFNETAGI